jgi:hypothetical protein
MRRLGTKLLFLSLLSIAPDAKALKPDRFVPTLGLTYASQYMTDGFRVGDATPVLQTSLKLDIASTDFSLLYWNSLRTVRSKKEFDEHDFMILYTRDFNEGTRSAFNFHGFYDYWTFPNTRALKDPFGDKLTTGKFRGSKLNAGVTMARLLPLAGSFLVPAYNVYYWIYWAQDRSDQYRGGARHEISLSYTHALPDLGAEIKTPYAGVSTSLSYNDGAFGVRPGMSHSVATLYAGLSVLNIGFALSANQQFSHQRTVNARNDFWTAVSAAKEF